MEKLFAKLDEEDVQTLLKLMKQAESSSSTEMTGTHQPPPRLELLPVDLKLDGPATYLSWSRRIMGALAGRGLEGYLTGDENEPSIKTSVEWKAWKATHMSLYTWLLNSMVPSIATTVDGIQSVKDMWAKLQRTYAGKGNNLRVFQIEQEIDAVWQGDRTVQEYAIELERLWADYDHFSPVAVCKDPECKSMEVSAQRRAMQFLKHLNSAFDHKRAVLLAQEKIPTLDEAIATMIQEESRMKLLSDATGLPGQRSALTASKPIYTETRKCYNCGEVGHLSRACPKPQREREAGGRGQFGGRGRGRGGRRGGRGGSFGGHKANLTVAEEEDESHFTCSAEEQEVLEMWRRMKLNGDDDKKVITEKGATSAAYKGNMATYAHSNTGDISREEDRSHTWDWHLA